MSIKSRLVKPLNALALAALTAAFLILPAGAGAQADGTATPEEAVSVLIKPLHDPSAGDAACNALSGRVDDCPVTAELRERLKNPIPNVETGNLVSRSQNPPRSVTVLQVNIIEDTAYVMTGWDYGDQFESYRLEFIVKSVGGRWLVADTTCEGNQETSIFRTPVGPCTAESGAALGGAAPEPGMPRTGSAEQSGYGAALLLGALAVTFGLALLLRARSTSHLGAR